MQASIACQALRAKLCLDLRYDGFSRLVEVHAVGTSKDGHGIILAWQVGGGSASGQSVGWKLFRLDAVRSAHLSETASLAPRQGYKRGGSQMQGGIICQL